MQSKIIPITKLELNKGQVEGLPANPRLIKDDKYSKLKQSIQEDPEMLQLRELLVIPNQGRFVVIGGNMRFRVCKDLGFTEMPCKVIPEGTPVEKLKAYSVKDNVNYGEWDWSMLANEWDISELQGWGMDIPEFEIETEDAKEDDFNVEEAIPEIPITQLGDIYILGDHRLVCGDSIQESTLQILMGDRQADLIITDPPYNVDYEGSDGKKIENDKMSDENFKRFLTAAFSAANSALKQGGAFYIWHADSEGFNFRAAAADTGWKIRQCLIWNKNSLVMGRQDYQWKHEPCLYGWKAGAAHFFINDRSQTTIIEDKIEINKLSKAELQAMLRDILEGTLATTIIAENKPHKNGEHPTMKPIKLLARLMKNSSKRGEIVLDTFGGSGSTMITAEQLGRKCRMVELDPIYCDVIVKRWQDFTGKVATRITTEMQQAAMEGAPQ